jgi:hypothetical protein
VVAATTTACVVEYTGSVNTNTSVFFDSISMGIAAPPVTSECMCWGSRKGGAPETSACWEGAPACVAVVFPAIWGLAHVPAVCVVE